MVNVIWIVFIFKEVVVMINNNKEIIERKANEIQIVSRETFAKN